MKNFIRSIFRIKLLESTLVFFLGKFPGSFLQAFISQNNAYPRGTIRTCTRHGIRYQLDISDYQNWLIYFHSQTDSSFGLLQYIKPGFSILDIGGNIGQTAMMMAKQTGQTGKVISFEPFPDTYRKFSYNLSLNPSLENIVSIEQLGLGSAPAELEMYQDCDTNSGANRMVPAVNNISGTVKVPVSTVDIFVAGSGIEKLDFIKIDVEGFEMHVLRGAIATLEKFGPAMFIELDDNNLKKQGGSAHELCTFLKAAGYRIMEEGTSADYDYHIPGIQVNIYCTKR